MNSANNRPAATGWHAGNVALLLVRTSMAGLALHGVVIGANAFYDADDIFIYYGPTGISLQSVSSSGPTGSRDLLPHGMAVSTDATVLISTWGGSSAPGGVYFQPLPAPPP